MEFFFYVLGWIILITFVLFIVVIAIAIYIASKEDDTKIDLFKIAEKVLEKK